MSVTYFTFHGNQININWRNICNMHILPIEVDLISIRAYRAWTSGAGVNGQ